MTKECGVRRDELGSGRGRVCERRRMIEVVVVVGVGCRYKA